jgi:hypothetical protein
LVFYLRLKKLKTHDKTIMQRFKNLPLE